ncbi:DUF6906 family protein [Bacillus sp. OxB-1]|uniref:DUF6906 family protein n=1 Tax=Bacillus sp. (strain OxB-1) TaxID=98228 RepID=UPI00156818F3|nr:hypothetical protein [Bacillus sp. OxB-1]
MKRGRKPSVAECNHIKSFKLAPANWLISKKMTDEWLIVHRESGKPRVIPAP